MVPLTNFWCGFESETRPEHCPSTCEFRIRYTKSRLGTVADRVIRHTADLYVVTERVCHVQAEHPAVAHLLHTHRGQIGLDAFAVEIGNRVSHMVDHTGRLRPLDSGCPDCAI